MHEFYICESLLQINSNETRTNRFTRESRIIYQLRGQGNFQLLEEKLLSIIIFLSISTFLSALGKFPTNPVGIDITVTISSCLYSTPTRGKQIGTRYVADKKRGGKKRGKEMESLPFILSPRKKKGVTETVERSEKVEWQRQHSSGLASWRKRKLLLKKNKLKGFLSSER